VEGNDCLEFLFRAECDFMYSDSFGNLLNTPFRLRSPRNGGIHAQIFTQFRVCGLIAALLGDLAPEEAIKKKRSNPSMQHFENQTSFPRIDFNLRFEYTLV
jgi:hypothetical protein